MTSRDFAFWLQGFFEIQHPLRMDEAQVEMVKRHLNMVFLHEIDPSMPDKTGALQAAHSLPFSPTNQPVVRC